MAMRSPDHHRGRRSQLFGSTRKLSQVFGRSPSPGPSSGPPSSLALQISIPDSSPSYNPNHLRPPSHSPTASTSSSLNPLKKRQSVSPAVVTGILNSMYAHPVDQRVGPSSQAWGGDESQLRRTPSGTTGTVATRASGGSRSSSGRKSTKTIQTQPQAPAVRPRVVSNNAISVGSREAKPDIIIAKGRKAPSTSSNDTSNPGSLRVVGRGGSGSRPRAVAPQSDNADPSPRQQEAPTFYRPNGRGGFGSRQRPIDPTPPLFGLLPIRKKDKGKDKAPPPEIHPIPPLLAYQIANGSSSTLGSLHFTGETGEPAPNFFPTSPSFQSVGSDNAYSETPPFSATSSTFESISIPSETDSDLHFYPEDSTRAAIPSDDRRARNLNKLARTLGDFPADAMYDALTREQRNGLPKLMIQDTEVTKPNTKLSKRSSFNLSVSSFGNLFLGRPARIRNSSATLSTMGDLDLHPLDLSDQLSESWGEVDASSIRRSESPGSPITFAPPSPVKGPNATSAVSSKKPTATSSLDTPPLVIDEGSSVGPESTPGTPTTLTPTILSRPHSFSHATRVRRSGANGSGHAYSSSTSMAATTSASTTAFSQPFHTKANWLIPPAPDDEQTAFAFTGAIPDKPQGWTGEWNSDMEDVIKALRQLR